MKTLLLLLFPTFLCFAQTNSDRRQIYLADPAIFHFKNTYYLYGTVEGQANDGFKVYSSTNQKDWKDEGFALKKGESYGEKGFWAPQVFHYQNQFFMAYVANENIAIATSNSPLGPFKQSSLIPLSAPVKQIDPFVYFDENGRVYLYHVRLQNGNRLFVAEMKPDLSGILEETLVECLHAENGWENTANSKWTVAEGPTILKKGDYYYLFYSANDFRNPDYAVGYAVSKSPLGPWVKYEGNPVLSKKDVNQNGPGHGDFYFDKKGNLNYVLHTHFSPTQVSKRKTANILFKFRKDGNSFQKPTADFKSFQFLSVADK